MPLNPWIANSFLDSCAFDPKYDPEDKAAIEVFRLHEHDGLPILLAHSTQKETEHPNTPPWVKIKAAELIYTIAVSLTPNETSRPRAIRDVLSGKGLSKNVEQDARHIFEAQKYGSYFVTTDGRLLQRAETIRTLCTVEILLPSDFLERVHRYRRRAER